MKSVLEKKTNYNTIRVAVHLWMKNKKLSTAQLAESLNISQQSIYHFINGRNDSCEILLRLIKYGFNINDYKDILSNETRLSYD